MRRPLGILSIAACLLTATGCSHLSGKPGFRAETMRPDQVHDFAALYGSHCAACHGGNGMHGAALPLNNPVYLAWAGHDRLVQIVAHGVPHSLMPAFGQAGGGLLTDQQVEDIVQGMLSHWSGSQALQGTTLPGYAATGTGDTAAGQSSFERSCARCHGVGGEGMQGDAAKESGSVRGSIVDPTYLSLISEQGLRDWIVAGAPDRDMPGWAGDTPGQTLTDKDVTDVVAWLESHRAEQPGQPAASPAMQQQQSQEKRHLGSSRRNLQGHPQ